MRFSIIAPILRFDSMLHKDTMICNHCVLLSWSQFKLPRKNKNNAAILRGLTESHMDTENFAEHCKWALCNPDCLRVLSVWLGPAKNSDARTIVMFSDGTDSQRWHYTMQLTTICSSLYFRPRTNQSKYTDSVIRGASNRRTPLSSERTQAKMAVGSDLLDDVFLSTVVVEKVVSNVVGASESPSSALGCVNCLNNVLPAAQHDWSWAVCTSSNVKSSKMGLSQQETAKAGKIAARFG